MSHWKLSLSPLTPQLILVSSMLAVAMGNGREGGICAEFARSRTRFSSARDVVCTRIIWKWEVGDWVLVLPTFVLQSPEESLVE